MKLKAITLLAALAAPSVASAQFFDVVGMIQSLEPEKAGPIVRSITANSGFQLSSSQPIPAGMDFPTINLQIEFAQGGHVLTIEGMRSLRALALTLKDPKLADGVFQIGGHYVNPRDPIASQPISHRRAAAVVEHLIAFYDVPADRIAPYGYGQTKLLDPTNPQNPMNTRIEIINLTTSR